MKLVTLTTWAAKIYPDNPPARVTLRRWARNGNIYPPPSFMGVNTALTRKRFISSPTKREKSCNSTIPTGELVKKVRCWSS